MRRNLEKIKTYLAVCRNEMFPAPQKKLRDSVILTDPRIIKAKNHKKREQGSVMKKFIYHVIKREDVVQEGVITEIEVLLSKGAHSGLPGHYKLYADPDLGVRKLMLQWIPCECAPFKEFFKRTWKPGVPAKDQIRF